ncbi:cupin domain-containing protein [Aspergillus stella-maris]|uniref:cupin domain-containing protein n=1 Tax=Aspergillus stella-maris TaxID=1810926 RepID=UPI003CCE2960
MSNIKIPASDIKVVKSGDTYQVVGRPRETFEITKIYHPPNIPGKQIIVGRIFMDPNSASPPHTHGGAAIVAVVTEGTVLNQMNDDDPILTKQGECFYEGPGCHHVRSENNTGEKAAFTAVLVVDDEVVKDGYQNIFVLDAERGFD